jgi:uncharacterized membrane protein YhaH (DUF805 family)
MLFSSRKGRPSAGLNLNWTSWAAFFAAMALGGVPAWAQFNNTGPNQPNPAAGAAACGGCGLIFAILFLAIIAINIAILVWVARDSKARGMDNSVLWMVLVIFTGWVGLIIYILSRPKGNLIECPNCKNKRLQSSIKCPQCGAA